jgi:hypothetical protein
MYTPEGLLLFQESFSIPDYLRKDRFCVEILALAAQHEMPPRTTVRPDRNLLEVVDDAVRVGDKRRQEEEPAAVGPADMDVAVAAASASIHAKPKRVKLIRPPMP